MVTCLHNSSIDARWAVISNNRCRDRSARKSGCFAFKSQVQPAVRVLNIAEGLSLAGSCTMCVMILVLSRKQMTPPALSQPPPSHQKLNETTKFKKGMAAAVHATERHATQHVQESTDHVSSMALGSIQNSIFLQGAMLLVAVLCRSISSLLSPSHTPLQPLSADVAARLSLLEQHQQAQERNLHSALQRLEKCSLRYKLYQSEIKRPLQQVQVGLEQQAVVMTQLSAAQEESKKQVELNEKILNALQIVASKQFKVTMDSINRLQEEHASLNQGRTHSVIGSQQHSTVSGSQEQRDCGLRPLVPQHVAPSDPWLLP
ncbi:hypothetical protein CEUSTIGMA_g416.t1 [Chlamydomonas eustigma]|uniref:Uncharacterized protein n=1 Tax=Chlamydomonas eustigma TaxID=1157962 RepID=A0A250WQ89_9CHLO|nr:hypothetical protein CEUSTIGMA_g416.t1 [Chlamydomonas eustigma]|eukprot:GAX72961.1 hypothetical protein CEUSTIGMA_g416.t1 [Chlamydomonas eustigma]